MSIRHVGGRVLSDPARVICGAAFLMAFALGLVNLGLVFHAHEHFGFSATRVGWLPATHSLTYVVACLFLSTRLRRASPRRLVLGALLCMGGCFLALGLGQAYFFLIALCAVYGVCLSLFWPFLMGWMSAGREGEALARSFSRYNFSWCSAMAISPYVCGRLSEIDTRLPIWAGAGLALTAFVWVAVMTPSSPSGSARPVSDAEKAPPSPAVGSSRWRYPAWLGIAASFFGVGIFAAAFPVGAREHLGFSLRAVGVLLVIRASFNMVAFLGLGYSHRWHFRSGPMLLGQALGVIAFGGLVFVSHPVLIGGLLALAGVSVAFSYSISVFHGVSGASDRSSRMAIHEAMLAIGLVCGSAGGAMVYDGFGLPAVFAVAAVLLLVILAVQTVWAWALRGQERRRRCPVTPP